MALETLTDAARLQCVLFLLSAAMADDVSSGYVSVCGPAEFGAGGGGGTLLACPRVLHVSPDCAEPAELAHPPSHHWVTLLAQQNYLWGGGVTLLALHRVLHFFLLTVLEPAESPLPLAYSAGPAEQGQLCGARERSEGRAAHVLLENLVCVSGVVCVSFLSPGV